MVKVSAVEKRTSDDAGGDEEKGIDGAHPGDAGGRECVQQIRLIVALEGTESGGKSPSAEKEKKRGKDA
jgi:hypothetical protein